MLLKVLSIILCCCVLVKLILLPPSRHRESRIKTACNVVWVYGGLFIRDIVASMETIKIYRLSYIMKRIGTKNPIIYRENIKSIVLMHEPTHPKTL